MKYIGAHVSTQGGIEYAPLNAMELKANAFAMFTRNQKRWISKPYEKKNIIGFKENLIKAGIKPEHVLPHSGYLINIGNPEKEMRKKSLDALIDESQRVEQLGLLYLNFHPGSHLNKISEEESLNYIIEGIEEVFKATEYITLVLETTAGQGTNLGYKFEHLKYIIEGISDKSRIGVCIDTAHIYSAGYDIKTKTGYEQTMKEFDKIIGLKYLKGFHLNDSKVAYNSKKDRHESLGKGMLGIEVFKYIIRDKRTDNIPLILETTDKDLWKEEIKLLRSFEN